MKFKNSLDFSTQRSSTHINAVSGLLFIAQLAELFIQADQNAVCLCVYLDVNQVGTNREHCTQRLVILHSQTY